jgi:hypothetical protein
VAGLVLAVVIAVLARRRGSSSFIAALLALGLTMTAECAVELVEYPLIFGTTAKAAAYYDTIADIGMTLVGAVVGSLCGCLPAWRRGRRG